MTTAACPPNDTAAKIMRAAQRLTVLPPESPLALANILIILEQLGTLARGTIEIEFPAVDSLDEIEGRNNWMRTLHFLAATNLFPGINDLFLALSELNRGRQLPSLKPLITGKGSGSRTTYQELAIQKQAVELGNRISAFATKDAEREQRFRDCGTSQWTLDSYRKSCNDAAPIYWPEEDAFSNLGPEEAESFLGLQIALLKQLRSKRRKQPQAK